MIFLIDYERESGKIVELRSFEDAEAETAQQARLELELRLSHQGISREVVLLDAADEAALRKTHRRYFADLDELASQVTSD